MLPGGGGRGVLTRVCANSINDCCRALTDLGQIADGVTTRECDRRGPGNKGGDTGTRGVITLGVGTRESLRQKPAFIFHSYAMPVTVRPMLHTRKTRVSGRATFFAEGENL